jgi:hypothetical protein
MSEGPRLTLYTREGCHLCEEMLAGLHELAAGMTFEVDLRDIDADPRLVERYGPRIPVLTLNERTLCELRLDARAVREALVGAC